MNEEKSVLLISNDTRSWTDGTTVRVSWTHELPGTGGGRYRASGVRVLVQLAPSPGQYAVDMHLLERDPHSGQVVSDLHRRLDPVAEGFETRFDWHSFVSIPEQELRVTLSSITAVEPDRMLKDPISRRFNFLLSFAR